MPDSEKKKWTSPEVLRFESPDEVWARYKGRATPLELAAVTLLIERSRKSDGKRASRQERRA